MIINILEYLELSASTFPDKVAFADETSQITYRDLVRQAKAIGTDISNKLNNIVGQPIFVVINRGIESIIAFLGVVYSGNFYVPIDISMPINRLQLLLEAITPKAVLIHEEQSQFSSDIMQIKIQATRTGIIEESVINSNLNRQIDTDPLYGIFTSGSTGIPKCVVISHRSVIDMVEQFTEIFELDESCIFGNQAPFDFDVSVKDIYLNIKNSATMYVIDKKCFSFPTMLIDFLNTRRINTIIWAVSALKIISSLKTFENSVPTFIKRVMFSGEVMPCKVLNDWVEHLPDAVFVNLYGPTEITCNCSYYIINRAYANDETIPIGKPFRNTDIILLDQNQQVTKEFEKGEICVRGSSLALGYYRDPKKTEVSFSPNPLQLNYPETIYHTGDIGMFKEDRDLVFLGRADAQVKHMGHRIELGEIETAANALDFIDFSCCLHDTKREKLCLFYQAQDECNQKIARSLRAVLPKYMVPSIMYHYVRLPENNHGKTDRALLKQVLLENCLDLEN